MLDTDIEESIERYIEHIRRMNLLTDDQLRLLLRQKALEDQDSFQALKDAASEKALRDIKRAAKDIRGDPRKFARRADEY